MATVSNTFLARWRSKQHVGAARPQMKVEIRRGVFNKGYSPHVMLDGHHEIVGYFPKTPRNTPWHFTWTPLTEWKEIPSVLEATLEQDFDNNGIHRCTLQVENIAYPQKNGFAGIYHAIERGWLSPLRGYTPPGRVGAGDPKNEWYGLLMQNAQIRIWQGYGEDEMTVVFTGLLDDIETEARPDRISLTARDFGQLLVDQRFMGHVKDRTIKDPVTFADRRSVDNIKSIGGGARASSTMAGSPARMVCDDNPDSRWIGAKRDGPNFTDWVEIRVPEGRYEDVFVAPAWEGMEAWISVHAKQRKGNRPPKMDGAAIDPGWVDVGNGDVPGGNGGVPWMRHSPAMARSGRSYRLNHTLELGDDSVIRIHFRNLHKRRATGGYHAGVRRLFGRRRTQKADVKKKGWILVDDAADVVKIILRWAGFREWEVESAGARLDDNLVFNRSDFLIDAIKKIAEYLNYVFFIGDPSEHPDSTGVPIFRQNRAVQDASSSALTIRDTDMLTALKTRFTDEPLALVIRVRGKLASEAEGGYRDFVGSGADTLSAFQAYYRPPWAKKSDTGNRLANIHKHIVHVDRLLASNQQCHIAARYIAAAAALKSATAIAEIPANPRLELDDQVYLLDTTTGTATRLWVASRQTSFTAGRQTSWKMSLGGSLIDSPDLVQIRKELERLYQDHAEDAPEPPVILPTGGVAAPVAA